MGLEGFQSGFRVFRGGECDAEKIRIFGPVGGSARFFDLIQRYVGLNSSRPNYVLCRLPWPVVRKGHISLLSHIRNPNILTASVGNSGLTVLWAFEHLAHEVGNPCFGMHNYG